MSPRARILTAMAIMLVGLGIALCFRRTGGDVELAVPSQSDPLVLRRPPDAQKLVTAESSPAAPRVVPLPVFPEQPRPALPAVVAPSSRPGAPPELPKSYPAAEPAPTSRWGSSLGQMLPERVAPPATHKIIDGDSLEQLAERYLGSASRAAELFEANRGVLARPELLPIGVELKIPRTEQASAQAATAAK